MLKFLLLLFLFGYISLDLVNSAPAVVLSQVEKEDSGRQLDFPADNEIPGNSIPTDNRPVPRPRYPDRRPSGRQNDGILSRIANFFRNLLGGDRTTYGANDGNDGGIFGGGRDNESSGGILGFIRRAISGIIDSITNRFGSGSTPEPDAQEFPYQRPKLEPIVRKN